MRLSDRKRPGDTTGNYARLFDSDALGETMSTIHGAAIAAGAALENELTRLVEGIGAKPTGAALDEFLKRFPEDVAPGVYLAQKKQIKDSQKLAQAGGKR